MKKTHDYIHHYRGYWSDGGRCRIRIYTEDSQSPVVICSQLPDNDNTSVTNMAEYLAAEVIEEHSLPTPLAWIEHYPEHEGKIGEYSLITFSGWELEEAGLGGIWRLRIGAPSWSHLRPEEVAFLLRDRTGEPRPPSTVEQPRRWPRREQTLQGRFRQSEAVRPPHPLHPGRSELTGATSLVHAALREAASWGHRKPAPTPPARS